MMFPFEFAYWFWLYFTHNANDEAIACHDLEGKSNIDITEK
jgi:hypothetical protein